MIQSVKKLARVTVPASLLQKSSDAYNQIRFQRAYKAFQKAPVEPAFLDYEKIGMILPNYSYVPMYLYDHESIKKRGEERADSLLKILSKHNQNKHQFLELGCGDGMVSGILQKHGKTCTAIDFFDGGFDDRASGSGVVFHKMDAAEMQFDDSQYDFVFSYNAFEHFPKPDKVIAESLRVLKPGGLLYMEFSPLYMSSYGLHAYKSIPIPYCQHLFEESDMEKFIQEHKLDPVNFTTHVNRWTIDQFRKLWNRHEGEMDTIEYLEIKNYFDLHLIWKYPFCFKSKTTNFNNFTVCGIKALFQKK